MCSYQFWLFAREPCLETVAVFKQVLTIEICQRPIKTALLRAVGGVYAPWYGESIAKKRYEKGRNIPPFLASVDSLSTARQLPIPCDKLSYEVFVISLAACDFAKTSKGLVRLCGTPPQFLYKCLTRTRSKGTEKYRVKRIDVILEKQETCLQMFSKLLEKRLSFLFCKRGVDERSHCRTHSSPITTFVERVERFNYPSR